MNFFREGFISKRSEPLISSESINSLKSEHLKEGVSPIIACIETPSQFRDDPNVNEYLRNHNESNQSKFLDVNYFGDPDDLKNREFKNMGNCSYVISPIDNLDKFSKSFLNCTGLVAAGQKKETKENISVLSHQDPDHFLRGENQRAKFKNDLKQQLQKLKEKSIDKTIDVVIVGGNYFLDDKKYRDNYLNSIELLSEEVLEVFGFEPVIITGPKTSRGNKTDNIYYDNEHRRLYIVRQDIGDGTTESFLPSDIENQREKWK
jgi:hypothetical protein